MQPDILIADDHSMIRKGLKLNIQLNLNYTDITEAGSCNELMKILVKKNLHTSSSISSFRTGIRLKLFPISGGSIQI